MKKILISLVCLVSGGIATAQTPTYLDDSQPIEARIQDALSRMTLEEKVAMCHGYGKFATPGCERLGIPGLHMSDGPHGVRAEINWNDWNYANWTNDSCTAFPSLTALAATWNPALATVYGQALAEECLYREKNVILGPGINIARTPLGGRNFEYMGEDPYLAASLCVPYIQAVQRNGVATCVKHFVLNDQEINRSRINVIISDRALHEIYLAPFKAAVTKGHAWSIMGSYNKIRGQHGCHNELTLNKILKGLWNFDGCVVTDWGGCHDTYEAAMNGLDIEMGSYTNGLTTEAGSYGYEDYYLARPFIKMLREGKVPMKVLDDKASRILRLIMRTSMNRNRNFGSLASDEHHAAALQIADESIVLLKNNRGLLPLDLNKYKNILVVGENAQRTLIRAGGSSELKPKKEISPLVAIQNEVPDKITFALGYKSGRAMYGREEIIADSISDCLRSEAVEAAKKADLVIIVGGLNKNHRQDCEDGDRSSFALPFGQNKLIEEIAEVNQNLILVLCSGNAVEMPWIDKVPAIMQTWYGGSMAGIAIMDNLTGRVNPSGKLPITYGKKLSDYGSHSFGGICYPGDGEKEEYKDDILVGYRWFDTKGIKPLFAFGHGLSYTTFKYSNPTISSTEMTGSETIDVCIDVTNTGNFEGKETVQLYINDEKSSVMRPSKELKGFEKVSLSPGETKTVTFRISADDLKFYSEKESKWIAESGYFRAMIGASSADIKATKRFRLK